MNENLIFKMKNDIFSLFWKSVSQESNEFQMNEKLSFQWKLMNVNEINARSENCHNFPFFFGVVSSHFFLFLICFFLFFFSFFSRFNNTICSFSFSLIFGIVWTEKIWAEEKLNFREERSNNSFTNIRSILCYWKTILAKCVIEITQIFVFW